MKRHATFASIVLALALSGAAGASEFAYIPTLPAPAMPVVPMLPRLPSRIDTIIPGQLPTRSLPSYPNILPGLKAPSISLPGPLAKKPVSLPGAVIAKGRIRLAAAGGTSASEALKSLFDNARAPKHPAVDQDDFAQIEAVKGDSSHQTLPESDLEREIGIR